MQRNVILIGAAGRDFHNFNVLFRGRPEYRVVAFTAAQIPQIDDRHYPAELAGEGYPDGIPIYSESRLPELIRRHKVDLVVFSYSDISHVEVMNKGALVSSLGADFLLPGARLTMLASQRPVVSVCAVRTGCGKSQTTREICRILRARGKKVVVVRHPMPYGDLRAQAVQRFGAYDDLSRHGCTIEEREEYEPLVEQGITVFAGVDYERILRRAEAEAEVIVWDGGNNDTPFFVPDIHVVLLDPHRAGHEVLYWPGETNLRMADIAVINKVDSASGEQVERVRANVASHAPDAALVMAESQIVVERPEAIRGKAVLVVEDGPTLTHGGMASGAGFIAAQRHGAAKVVDPRPTAVGSLREVFRQHPHIEAVLPAMGYGREQMADLAETIERTECDLVLFATPIHLPRLLTVRREALRVRYEYRDCRFPTLEEEIVRRLEVKR